MSPLVVLIFSLHLTYIVCTKEGVMSRHLLGFPPQGQTKEAEEKPKEKQAVINVNSKGENKPDEKSVNIKTNEENKVPEQLFEKMKEKSTSQAPPTDTELERKVIKPTEMESGALLRGVTVVVVLTALVIVYMALKTYCRKRSKYPVMVNKYGVRTRRSDIEMTPLPLDEDEEDETVFEVGNTTR